MAQNNQKKYAQIKSPFYDYDEFAEFTPFALFQILRNLFIWSYNYLNYESISGNYITDERVEFGSLKKLKSKSPDDIIEFEINENQQLTFSNIHRTKDGFSHKSKKGWSTSTLSSHDATENALPELNKIYKAQCSLSR